MLAFLLVFGFYGHLHPLARNIWNRPDNRPREDSSIFHALAEEGLLEVTGLRRMSLFEIGDFLLKGMDLLLEGVEAEFGGG